jgi:cephalosporin hydroxylase
MKWTPDNPDRTLVGHRPVEADLLTRYAAKSREIVEIGVAYGASSIVLLNSMPSNGHLYSIDPFTTDEVHYLRATPAECRSIVEKGVRDSELLGRWNLLVNSSTYVAHYWPSQIDMMFIDGNHSYRSACEDFYAWYPYVKDGGYIVMHDANYDWTLRNLESDDPTGSLPGPTRLVQDVLHEPWQSFVDNYWGCQEITQPFKSPIDVRVSKLEVAFSTVALQKVPHD